MIVPPLTEVQPLRFGEVILDVAVEPNGDESPGTHLPDAR